MFDQKFSKLNLQMCPVCEKEKEIFYICDNCGSNFCIDCLDKKNPVRFECRRCKSTNVQILYPELYVLPNYKKNLICQYCGSNEYIEISSNKKVCPNCQSTHVFNIFEKKSQL